MLKEQKTAVIRSVVKHIPRATVIEVLAETVETQSLGGLKTKDNLSRTAGGVFLTLLKKHASVTKEMHKKLKHDEKRRSKDKKFTVALVNGLELGEASDQHCLELEKTQVSSQQEMQTE